jgi:hypothetical protein
VAVGDSSTGRATVSIDPDVPARAIWQSGDLGEKWRQCGLRNIFIHARKVLSFQGPVLSGSSVWSYTWFYDF